MVQVIWLVIITFATFTAGYLGYSRYLASFLELDEEAETPAHKYEDGQEYVPAKKSVLLGHHYSSISGGAPVVGPITAGVIWGWVPAVLWIAIGNPLMGAVHDFVSLSGSMRHEGRSVGSIIGEYVGDRGKNMLLWFAFLTLILVVAVFAYVIAIVFDAFPSAATASTIYVGLALVFGLYLYQFDLPFIPGTAVFVAGIFASVWVGIQYPIALFATPELAGDVIVFFGDGGMWLPLAGSLNPNIAAWVPIIVIYAFIASVLPVWVLLQPRDFLSSFLLYAGVGGTLLAVIVGTIFGTAAQPLTIGIDAYNGFWGTIGLPLFPVLFVTIACGSISGFHSLVSSGTTAKQLNKETDARTIGYGGMLAEGLLATVALCTLAVAGLTQGASLATRALPNFATGGGIILTAFNIPVAYGAPFMALVLVTFLLTSTDTATRLGRYMLEEIIETPETTAERTVSSRFVSSGIIVVFGYLLVASGSWASLWPLFGGANQLLGALALLTATVWLANWDEHKQLISTGVPMVVMAVVTTLALLYLALVQSLIGKLLSAQWMAQAGPIAMVSVVLQIVIAFVLVGLGLGLLYIGLTNVREERESGAVAADGGERLQGNRERHRSVSDGSERTDGSRPSEDEQSEA
jgi:carbon starvation protein